MPFENVPLKDGNSIPAIGFGTGSVWKGQDVVQYVNQAIEAGFNHIDTATLYRNEEYVGQAIRESGLDRSDFFITTKYGAGSIPREELEKSLSKLGLKSVDLYLIHFPGAVVPDFISAWKQFQQIKADGLAKSIGVSNFMVEDLEQVINIGKSPPVVNQIQLHPYNYVEMKPVLEYCKAKNIVIEAYGSLAPLTTYPGGPVDAPLEAAALVRGATTSQIIQLWVKSKGVVIVTTSSSKQHLEEYLSVFDLPPLTEVEIAAIEKAAANGPPSSLKVRIMSAVKKANKNKMRTLVASVGVMMLVAFQVVRYL
ncbi:NADP-dependent oxidoreductase domain-containing protein [Mycena floridula]|nr:NADP-dependent oxidoreductase domain-containing protein [Mycena floridula]